VCMCVCTHTAALFMQVVDNGCVGTWAHTVSSHVMWIF